MNLICPSKKIVFSRWKLLALRSKWSSNSCWSPKLKLVAYSPERPGKRRDLGQDASKLDLKTHTVPDWKPKESERFLKRSVLLKLHLFTRKFWVFQGCKWCMDFFGGNATGGASLCLQDFCSHNRLLDYKPATKPTCCIQGASCKRITIQKTSCRRCKLKSAALFTIAASGSHVFSFFSVTFGIVNWRSNDIM